MGKIRKWVLSGMAVLLFCLGMIAMAQGETEQMPQVRVRLTRLGLQDRAEVHLQGITSLSGPVQMLLPAGSTAVFELLEGQIILTLQGVRMELGQEVTLLQHEGSGLRFQAEGNRFPGELTHYVAEDRLNAVLALPVEEYLLGCVAYEMNDSFPLEALKAQAVCARTYALSHLNPAQKWDVVDTANDQVFRGINDSYRNVERAVRETAGMVGTWKGSLAQCFYSASNGGQTDLVGQVWSDRQGDWGYYRIVDDPYDLSNPESPVRRTLIRKDGQELEAALGKAILEAAMVRMKAAGYGDTAEFFRLDAISGLQLGTPRFAAPSRLVTQLSFTVDWSARHLKGITTPDPATGAQHVVFGDWEKQPAISLTLPLFPDLVRDLGMRMNGGMNNEMVTMAETDDAYILEARRYGHGVGMSQRGAQWMAGQYGKGFLEILGFYYPGMQVEQRTYAPAAVPTPRPVLAATPVPSASPTPRPTLMPVTMAVPKGAYLASVEGIEEDSSLNLRSEPSLSSEIVMRLYAHQPLIVLETSEDGQWVHVCTDRADGYVMKSFLEKVEQKK